LLLWALAPGSLDGVDAVGFALALGDYDPGLEQPHPPGYPLYIALCRLIAALGASDVAALALPGILASPVLVWASARCARALGLGPLAAAGASLWTGLHPLLLCEGPRPAPDLLGAAAVWGALALGLEQRAAAAGAVFGLALGVRPDLAPFGALLLGLEARERRHFAAGICVGVALWAIPLLTLASPAWAGSFLGFARGHFSVWGSSALSGAGDASEWLRALGLASTGPAGALLAALGARRARWPRALALGCAAYALWIALGQNLAHARHWLPLAPALALLGTLGIASLARPRARALAAGLAAALALPGLLAARRSRLDGEALVARAIEACAGCDAVYAGASARLFARYAPPGFPAFRRSDLAAIRLDLEAWGLERARLIATDEIDGVAERGLRLGSVGPIGLYRIDPAALR
jgi:hypothetical protein